MLLCAFFGSAREGAGPDAAARWAPPSAGVPVHFAVRAIRVAPVCMAGRKFQPVEHPSAREQGPPPPPLEQLRAKERCAPPAPRQPGATLGAKFGQPGASHRAEFSAAARGGDPSSAPREFVPVPKKKYCRAGATPPPVPSSGRTSPARVPWEFSRGPRHLFGLNSRMLECLDA